MTLNRNQLLALSISFTMLLLGARILFSGRLMYGFLAWNIVLATAPAYLSHGLVIVKNKWLQGLFFLSWLGFFPNSFYILTDLVHLEPRPGIPFWFDIILVFSAALNGLLLGYCSMLDVENYLVARLKKIVAFRLMMALFIISSFGVYVGRYLRWNTWDVVLHPFGLSQELLQHFTDPFAHFRTWGMTLILSVFFALFYFTVKMISVKPSDLRPQHPA